MARKLIDSKPGNRPGLRVVDKPAEAAAATTQPPPPERPHTETIFIDKRTGRDRREEAGLVFDSRRTATNDRRQRKRPRTSWWLERDYVESHHFVQKSSSARARKRDFNPSEE